MQGRGLLPKHQFYRNKGVDGEAPSTFHPSSPAFGILSEVPPRLTRVVTIASFQNKAVPLLKTWSDFYFFFKQDSPQKVPFLEDGAVDFYFPVARG